MARFLLDTQRSARRDLPGSLGKTAERFRVYRVESMGEDGDGASAGVEGGPVGDAVDA